MENPVEELKDHFSNYSHLTLREQQAKGISFALNSDKRFIVVSAPTGSGKSLLGLCICADHEYSSYLVHSKSLQDQITQDFPEVYSIFGRNNYPCAIDDILTADKCFYPTGCPASDVCEYKIAKQEALDHRYRVLNYHYFIFEANYAGRFSGQPIVIVDEADSLENLLYGFIEIRISEHRLKKYGIGFPQYKTTAGGNGTNEWRCWGQDVMKKLDKEVKALEKEVGRWPSKAKLDERQLSVVKQLNDTKSQYHKFTVFVQHVDDSWLQEIIQDKYGRAIKFKPIWMKEELAEMFFWKHASKFVLMSASFPPKEVIAKTLGIDQDEIDSITLDSTFAVENRTNYLLPVAPLSSPVMPYETPRLLNVIKQIMDRHPHEKGLIHSVSWGLNDRIMEDIRDSRLVTHSPTDKTSVLEYFKKSRDPLVLVSPSSERGIDLADDFCRFIIVAKAPFLHLGDKGTNSRLNSGPVGRLWYVSNMMMTVLQMLGRGVRNERDHCTSYILDSMFMDNLMSYPSVLPPWFRDSLILASPQELNITIPPPAVYPPDVVEALKKKNRRGR